MRAGESRRGSGGGTEEAVEWRARETKGMVKDFRLTFNIGFSYLQLVSDFKNE